MSIFVLIVGSTVMVRYVLNIFLRKSFSRGFQLDAWYDHAKQSIELPPSGGVISAHRCQIMACTIMIRPKSPSLFHSRGNEKQPSSGGPQKAYVTGMVPDVTPGKTKWKKSCAT